MKTTLLSFIAMLALLGVTVIPAAPPNLVSNGQFDTDVAGWNVSSAEAEVVWLSDDLNGSPTSGAMGLINRAVVNAPVTATGLPAVQCIAISPSTRYVLSAFAMVPETTSDPLDGPAMRLQFLPTTDCTFPGPPFPTDFMLTIRRDLLADQWSQLLLGGWAAGDAKSAHIALVSQKGQTPDSFMAVFDNVTLVALPVVARVPMVAASGQ